jgi:Na+-translocating ferredoxin:NAD+ oxidoreductase RnfD subunit
MATAMRTRAGALVFGPLIVIVAALIGRVLSALAPEPKA